MKTEARDSGGGVLRGLIALAAFAAYGGTFRAPFIFDDLPSIADNPTIRHLWPIGPVLSPPIATGVCSRPMVNASLALNYAVSGLSVWSYHVFNLLVHIGAAWALFGILRRTAARIRLPSSLTPETFAFAAALIWALHPLQTESVTCATQRTESLMGLFYLLTLYCFIRGARLCPPDAGSAAAVSDFAGREGRKPEVGPNLWHGLSWLACLLGMGTKEVMATAPVLVFLYDRTFVAGSFGEAWKRRKGYYAGLAATWLLLVYLVASTGGQRGGYAGFGAGVSSAAYARTQFRAIAHYLRLAIWPAGLTLDYGASLVARMGDVAPQACLILALAVATAVALARRPAWGFLGAWFFVIIAPSSSIVPLVSQTMAEHRMYLPSAAIAVLAVLGLARLAEALSGPPSLAGASFGGRRIAVLGAALVVATALGTATFERNRTYRSELSIWRDTAEKAPDNPRAQLDLGLAYYRQGDFARAIACYEKTLRLDPAFPGALGDWGAALLGAGRPAEAAERYETALRARPDDAGTHYSLGTVWQRLGRGAKAEAEYRAAIRLDPGLAEAHGNLATLLRGEGHTAEAMAEYRTALRLDPGLAETHGDFGNALLDQGKIAEAIEEDRTAVGLRPGAAVLHYNLGNALAQASRLPEAAAEYEEALRLQPKAASIHNNLGGVYYEMGRLPEAVEQYEIALRLDPNDAVTRQNLARARAAAASP